MEQNQQNILENISKNGLLPNKGSAKPVFGAFVPDADVSKNIFSPSATPFGNLTIPTKQIESKTKQDIVSQKSAIDGFDTDMLSNSKFRKIDDKILKLKVKIARLQAELEEHKKTVEASFLKADKSQYQKLLEIQQKMETEIQRLVAEYQHRQLLSIVFSPFVKLFHILQTMLH